MTSVGVVAEFNPFHNGHQYFLSEARKKTDADCVIAVMSGSFTQRGDIALYDKWKRTAYALSNGADIIFELPAVFALSSADFFARGAMFLLKSAGADAVSFGIEPDSESLLRDAVKKTQSTDENFRTLLLGAMKKGYGYPRALSDALKLCFGISLAEKPNTVLGLSYMREAEKLNFSPTFFPIERRGALHDKVGKENISSASHIRELVRAKKLSNAQGFVPCPLDTPDIDYDIWDCLLLAGFRIKDSSSLKEISGISEGLENRLLRCAEEADWATFLKRAVTKRYTAARIRRVAVNNLLDITADMVHEMPSYLRLLGANEIGRKYLKEQKGVFTLPVITKVADAPLSPMLQKDIKATDLRALCSSQSEGSQDFYRAPIML